MTSSVAKANSPFPANGSQRQLFPDRHIGLFLVAVHRDGSRGVVVPYGEFEIMREDAGKWLDNPTIAWVSLNYRIGRVPHQTHLVTRGHNGEMLVTEQAGRLPRVARTRTRSQGMAGPV